MINKKDKNTDRLARHARVRKKVSGTADRPRLDVYRSNSHIYAAQEADRHREAVRRRYYVPPALEFPPRPHSPSDRYIRAAKGHRRLEGSPQVHAAVLSGYTETR